MAQPTIHTILESARITYTLQGRSGQVHFHSAATQFSMDYEFGTGSCVAFIFLPSLENWERETALPLSYRTAVLEFIGQQVVKDQVPSGRGRYSIDDNWLNINN